MKRALIIGVGLMMVVTGCGQGGDGAGAGMVARLMDVAAPDQGRHAAGARFAQLVRQDAPAMQIGVETRDTATVIRRETLRDGVATWISLDGASITLKQGLLQGTRGFGGDMMSSDTSAAAALIRSGQTGEAARFHSFITGENKIETRSYFCDISSRGARDIQVGTQQVATQLIEEKCLNPAQGFTNLYWVDRRGAIVQSRQWAGAFTQALVLRTIP